ncbi:type VI secretion system protein [Ramlibacter sp.]|uniref:type VI secretion system protein n=1 Tax=Ramlibacter sp. TaxID=1917967 RepID=UPI003D1212D5
MLNFLADNLVIVALLGLTAIAILLLGLVFWAAVQNEEAAKKRASQPKRPQMKLESLKQSFRGAVELIENNLVGRSERYNLAWSVVLNEGETEGPLPIMQSGLPSALGTDSTISTAAAGIQWNFFDKGVAVQLQSAYLGAQDDQGREEQKTWDEFLGLCRGYRPDRPFDSIVLAIPARQLLASDAQAQLELVARAKAIHRRLWLAQNRFALRFPIYLVVSGCDQIAGFSRFAAALPEGMRRGLLGWSSPFEVGAPYQPQWVDQGMDDVTRDVSDATSELCALESPDSNSADYFMLATDIERLRPGLKLFMDELMRPSAYHEPFIFRGFYLTGDCSAMAELLGTGQHARLAGPDVEQDEEFEQLPDETSDGLTALPSPVMTSTELEPAFLRDIFEKKVFPEAGLARASTTQRMRHSAVGSALRWSAAAIVAVWVCGLAWATYSLNDSSKQILAALDQLERDTRASLQEQRNETFDLDGSRRRTLATLSLMERVDANDLWSVFMPGSWSSFDSVQERLKKKLESSFSRNSVQPLRLSFYARMSQLTGTPLDSATGQPIVGASCNWRGGVTASTGRPVLNPEDLPEFQAVLHYVTQIEELDRAVRAFERLREGTPSGAQDLNLVVRTLMGVQLPGDASRTAALFHQHAKAAPPLQPVAMEAAARCGFQQAMRALHERLFERNDLLAAERAMMDRINGMMADSTMAQPAVMLAGWQGVLDAMREEEALFAPGKGAWVRRRTLSLGGPYDALLQRAQAVALIGRSESEDARRKAEEHMGRFLAAWDDVQNDRRAVPGRGLRWLEAENKWAFSEERAAIRDSLGNLLGQAYMRPGRGKLPDVPNMASVMWDRARLDQALAYADARKKFQTELLPKFPPMMQQGVERTVNAVLAEQIVDVVAQGMVLTERSSQVSAIADADRQRVVRIRVLLAELGARLPGETLAAVLVRDAKARLRALDETFAQGEVFVPRELRAWTGEKGPLVSAFGTGDSMGLAAYVAQQQAFVDSSAREAEALLAAMEGSENADATVNRWRGIVADVAKYRLKSPASNLQQLEQFILNASADIDLANCTDKLSRMAQRRSGDVFGERLVNLQVRLVQRCRELRTTENRDGWMKFVEVFNRDVAGRVPFKTGAPLAADRYADLDEVASALKAYERAAKSVERNAATQQVKRFDEQMERVKTFMAPLFTAEEGAAQGYDLAVDFRANPQAEIEGNKIIEWSVSVGGHTLKQREPVRPLRWEPGTPIVVSMRLARDGPVAPVADPLQPAMVVEDRTVTYRFTDPWSLFSFITSHREAEGQNRGDAKTQLLRFEFPIVSSGDPLKGSADSRARVFLRLAVSPAGKKSPLAWPGTFPTRAPEWTASTETVNR